MDASSTIARPVPKHRGGAELRERKLRQDPWVEVLSPILVRCNKCHSEIKLSMKSDYDPHHWTTHRKRCAKSLKLDAAVAATAARVAGNGRPPKAPRRPSLSQVALETASAPAGRRISSRKREVVDATVPSAAQWQTSTSVSAARLQRASSTPPLTPDRAAGSISECESLSTGDAAAREHSFERYHHQRSPSPSPRRLPPLMEFLDGATLAYMSRCHADVPLDFSCSQQEWSWDRLKLPSFLEPQTGPVRRGGANTGHWDATSPSPRRRAHPYSSS